MGTERRVGGVGKVSVVVVTPPRASTERLRVAVHVYERLKEAASSGST
jgi:hypothetical protein